MSEPKRILIVEDHYETIDFLRNAFNLLSERVDIIGILSGEEAWLELLRGDIDLLMVDLRLPGMSGSELLVRVQKRYPDLPAIVMSGSALEIMKRETAGMTIHRFLEKPMDIDALLEIVEQILFGRQKRPVLQKGDLPEPVRQQLDQLRVDTGARQLLLASLEGGLLYQSGEEATLTDETILAKMGLSMKGGLEVAYDLAAENPRSIQFLSTGQHEFYFANIGLTAFVTLVYGAQNQRARIGTIWVFLQRAIRELQQELADLLAQPDLPAEEPVDLFIPAVVIPEPEEVVQENIPMGDPLTMEEALAQGLIPTEFVAADDENNEGLDLFGDLDLGEGSPLEDDADLALLRELAEAAEESEDEPSTAVNDGSLDFLDDGVEQLDEAELAAFWDAAVEDQEK